MSGNATLGDFRYGFVIGDVDVAEAESIKETLLQRATSKSHDVAIARHLLLADVVHAEGSSDRHRHVAVDFGVEADPVVSSGAGRMPVKDEDLLAAWNSVLRSDLQLEIGVGHHVDPITDADDVIGVDDVAAAHSQRNPVETGTTQRLAAETRVNDAVRLPHVRHCN